MKKEKEHVSDKERKKEEKRVNRRQKNSKGGREK